MSKLVLITGINGFVAGRTAEAFLKAGFSVRGTARNRESTNTIVDLLSKLGHIEIAEVKDITVPHAFDEVVKGVTHIAHLASPVSFDFTDPDPVIQTAVNGTTEILESALTAPTVQSVVFMSSVVAIYGDKGTPIQTWTEADWNTQSLDLVAKLGPKTPGRMIYVASKTAAEQAFWKWRDEHKPSFAMSAINPVYVNGAPLIAPTRPEQVPLSAMPIYRALAGQSRLSDAQLPGQSFVDVLDVARVVVFAVKHSDAVDGQRHLLAGGYVPQQAVHDILRRAYPERADLIEEGTPGEGYDAVSFGWAGPRRFDASKAAKVTGQGWIGAEESVLASAKAFEGLL